MIMHGSSQDACAAQQCTASVLNALGVHPLCLLDAPARRRRSQPRPQRQSTGTGCSCLHGTAAPASKPPTGRTPPPATAAIVSSGKMPGLSERPWKEHWPMPAVP